MNLWFGLRMPAAEVLEYGQSNGLFVYLMAERMIYIDTKKQGELGTSASDFM